MFDEPESFESELEADPIPDPLPVTKDLSTIDVRKVVRPASTSAMPVRGPRPPIRKKFSSGRVVMWSACRDGEEAGELIPLPGSRPRGAMTYVRFFLSFLTPVSRN